MSFRKLPKAEIRKGDGAAMVEAIEHLLAAGVDVRRPHGNSHQLKVNETTSYYPTRQSIFVDGEAGLRSERGLAALIDLLGLSAPSSPGAIP